MKKLYYILLVLGVILIIEFFFFSYNAKASCEKLFGIDESKYQVITMNNSLSAFHNGGRYRITLKIDEKNYDYSVIIEDLWGLNIQNIESLYKDTRFSRRTFISYLFSPVMAYRWAVISKSEGNYYVTLLYMEHNTSR